MPTRTTTLRNWTNSKFIIISATSIATSTFGLYLFYRFYFKSGRTVVHSIAPSTKYADEKSDEHLESNNTFQSDSATKVEFMEESIYKDWQEQKTQLQQLEHKSNQNFVETAKKKSKCIANNVRNHIEQQIKTAKIPQSLKN